MLQSGVDLAFDLVFEELVVADDTEGFLDLEDQVFVVFQVRYGLVHEHFLGIAFVVHAVIIDLIFGKYILFEKDRPCALICIYYL